jgi:hypothetical protein
VFLINNGKEWNFMSKPRLDKVMKMNFLEVPEKESEELRITYPGLKRLNRKRAIVSSSTLLRSPRRVDAR